MAGYDETYLKSYIMTQIRELPTLSLMFDIGSGGEDKDSIAQAILDTLESNDAQAPENLSDSECLDVIDDADMLKYIEGPQDFSKCKSAIECVRQEAGEAVDGAYFALRDEVCGDVAGALMAFMDDPMTEELVCHACAFNQTSANRLKEQPHSREYECYGSDSPLIANAFVYPDAKRIVIDVDGVQFVAVIGEDTPRGDLSVQPSV